MKIYRRAAFLELPAGVLYAKGKPWAFDGGLHRKGDTIRIRGENIDFTCADLVNIDMGKDSGEWADRLETMLEAGASFPMNEDYGRDGCFNDDEVFLVYENDDLAKLFSIISEARLVSP